MKTNKKSTTLNLVKVKTLNPAQTKEIAGGNCPGTNANHTTE